MATACVGSDSTGSMASPGQFDIERVLSPSLSLVKDKADRKLKVWREISPNAPVETLRDLGQKLHNPYFVSIEHVLTSPERILVITEYCEGGTLSSLIGRAKEYGENLNEIEVTDWFVQLLLALRHLHQQQIVHGHLLPSNIYLKSNCIKLSEPRCLKGIYRGMVSGNLTPGVTKHVDETTKDMLPYSSPEVIGGEEFTSAADMWSLGCVLFEMCSRKRLFRGSSCQEMKSKIQSLVLQKFPLDYRPELADVWRRLMVGEAQHRPSAEKLLQEPFIAEHLKDMEESMSKQQHLSSKITPETSDDVTSGHGLPVRCETDDDDVVDIDEDAILTEEDALQLLSP